MKVGITIECRVCGKDQPTIEIRHTQLIKWRDGWKIQEAMPQLTPDERELIISGTCGPCFDKMFPPGS